MKIIQIKHLLTCMSLTVNMWIQNKKLLEYKKFKMMTWNPNYDIKGHHYERKSQSYDLKRLTMTVETDL